MTIGGSGDLLAGFVAGFTAGAAGEVVTHLTVLDSGPFGWAGVSLRLGLHRHQRRVGAGVTSGARK